MHLVWPDDSVVEHWLSKRRVVSSSPGAGLLGAIVVLALGKPFTHTCYSGKPPACGPPTDPGDVLVQSCGQLFTAGTGL